MEIQKHQENLKAQVASGMLWKFAERIIAQGVSFVVSVILARLLMPEDYGAVAIVMIFVGIANVFLTSGLNVSLVQKKDANEQDFSTIFWCSFVLSLVMYGVLFLSAPFIAKGYKLEILTPVVRVFALSLPISAFQSVAIAIISRRMQFRAFFFATIIGTLISAVLGISMAYNGFGIWSLVAQSLTNSVIDTVLLFISVDWRPKLIFSTSSAIPMVNFGYKVTLTDLIGTVFNSLVAFLMGIKYTTADLAFYSNGIKIPRLFRDNIFVTVISVLFPAMSKVSDDREYVKKLARKAIGLMTYIIFPIMFWIMAATNTLIEVLYTNKWINMSPYVAISCLEAVISVIPTVGWQAIKSLGRSDILLKNEFITKPVYIACVVIGLFISPLAMVIGMFMASVYCTIIACAYIKRIVLYSYYEQLLDVMKSLLMSIVMYLFVFLIGLLNINIILKLIVQMLCGVLIYWLISVVSKDINYEALKGLIVKKIVLAKK